MCTQVNNLFKCGHRAFNKFDNCPEFVHTFSSLSLAPSEPRPPTSTTSLPPPGSSHVWKSTSSQDPPADQGDRESHVSAREASTRTSRLIVSARTVSCGSLSRTLPSAALLTAVAREQARRRTPGGMVTRGESTGRNETIVEAEVRWDNVSECKNKRGR